MTKRLGFGIIGCGEIAVQTATAIARSRYAQHAMVMDTRVALAQNLGEAYSVPWTDDVEELLDNQAVDAVYIAVPHHLHASLAMQAMRAGKHVLVEKPIAITLDDADAMVATARANGVWLSVNFHAQADPLCRAARDLVATGAIGQVFGTHVVHRSNKTDQYWAAGFTGRVQSDWRVSKETAGGGVLIMNMIHDLNTMRFITGLEVERVYAEYDTFATPVEVEDYVVVTYRYANAAIGTIAAGTAVRGGDPVGDVNRIYGTTGQILLGESLQVFVTETVAGLPTAELHTLPVVAATVEKLQAAMIDGFAGAIVSGRQPIVSAEDGRATLAVVLAAYQSGAEGRPISLASSRSATREASVVGA